MPMYTINLNGRTIGCAYTNRRSALTVMLSIALSTRDREEGKGNTVALFINERRGEADIVIITPDMTPDEYIIEHVEIMVAMDAN